MSPSSDTEAGVNDGVVRFTDRELTLIALSLPKGIKQQRRDLLPPILRDWVCMDLPAHLRQKPEPVQKRRERLSRLKRVETRAKELSQALAALDEAERWSIVTHIASPLEQYPKGLTTPNIERASQEIEGAPEWLPRLAAAAHDAGVAYALRKGPAPNVVPYLVLLDLAAIFEWLTCQKAVRTWFNRGLEEEPPPFHAFVTAVWPVLFGSDDGLSNAVRTWNDNRKKYGDRSLLMENLALRHPTWGIFD